MIDGLYRRVHTTRMGSYLAYVFRIGRSSWQWGIAFHGTTILHGTRGTMIDGKHAAEQAYGPVRNGQRQLTLDEVATDERRKESGDESDVPF